ncbi:MAG: LysM peptidoglycan-binding domain-containing protein [Gammaproteobacteria bacterium]|nr:LysM peptidoglycan-binding domain-containing protein [Gammaproteobacteria bacterium]
MPPTARSRYLFCQGVVEDGSRYLTDFKPYSYLDLPDNIFHEVQEGDSWDSLAGLYYKGLERACGYWWAIANFQPDGVVDPTLKLTPGSTIVVPSLRTLQTIIMGERRRRDYAAS